MSNGSIIFFGYFAYGIFNPASQIVFGGAEVQIYQLATQLAKTGKSVALITAGTKPYSQSVIDGVQVYKVLPLNRQNSIWTKSMAIGRMFYYLAKLPGRTVVQRALGPETGMLTFFCKLLGKRFVYMVAHDWDVNGSYKQKYGWLGKLAIWGLRHASVVLTQNHEQQAMLHQTYGKASTVFPTVYPIPATVLPRSLRKGILWVGRAEQWKQPELFINLAEQLPQQSFTMIMPAGNDVAFYQTVLTRARTFSNLTVLEQVPFTQIDDYFSRTLLLVNTSTMEGFPNTFIQATKNGTPIVSWRVNPDGIITTHNLGAVASDSSEQLVEQVQQLVTDTALWQQCSDHCHTYAQAQHDIKRWLPEFERLVQA
ncbi:MAG: glycosyltransferase family 4 protein [Candidatus Kerfeldbacteria bacterium]|nr:glycosyltransferase family 4 protein [Candidatus Kerfeldbacteria bacterium]